MKLEQFVKLGEELGRLLKVQAYVEAAALWSAIKDLEEREAAKQAFYQAAELSYQLTNANKAQKLAKVSHKK